MIPNEAHQHAMAHLRNEVKLRQFQIDGMQNDMKQMRLKLLLAGISENGDGPPSDKHVARELTRLHNPHSGLQVKQTAVNNVCGLLMRLGYEKTVQEFQTIFRK